MFIFKSILLFIILLLAFGFLAIFSLVGAIRALLSGNRDQTRRDNFSGDSTQQSTSHNTQPQQQRKIYGKDEGEYVDFTEV